MRKSDTGTNGKTKATLAKAAPPPPNPGEVIRQAREAKGWTQEELGVKLGGISKSRVSAIESWAERTRPTRGWLVQHADVWMELGISVKRLFGGYEDPKGPACPHCGRPW